MSPSSEPARSALRLTCVLVALIGVFTVAGLLATDVLAPNALTRFDQDFAERLEAGRTPVNDDRAHWGAMLAATEVKIAVTAIVALIAWVMWRRWREPLYLASTLILEATAFIVITTLVGRPRPDVMRLEDSPVNSSFPSGHVAAATVYGAFVVMLCWHTRRWWIRGLAALLVAAVVGIVAWARMYQGMHYFSDVVAGVVLGGCSLVACRVILGRPPAADDDSSDDDSTDEQSTGHASTDHSGPPAVSDPTGRPNRGESAPERVGTLETRP